MIPTLRQSRVGPKVAMLDKRKVSRDSETDRYIQLANGFLVLAEKELSAFISAVHKLFGAEQARQSALHWIEELELMDWPSGESARLASGDGGRKRPASVLGSGNSYSRRQRLGA